MDIGGAGKRMRAVDGKQEINLEWPYVDLNLGYRAKVRSKA